MGTMARDKWRDILSAPKDGTPIKIRGQRFMSDRNYTAVAVWTSRACPALTEGWFPPSDLNDRHGPYINVTDWRPLSPSTVKERT